MTKYTPDMQRTHLPHCQAPFPSWCPGSTPAQVPCAWRPSKMVRMSCLVFYLFILSFQLYFFNLSLWLPTWSTILLPAWMTTLVASTPWTVSPSCTSGEAVTAVDFFAGFCFSSGYQSCGLKGKFTAGKGNSSLWKPTSFRTLISHTWELSNHTITMPIKKPFRS